jgi:formate dehydrogenase iron-sulfur subunit
MSTQAAEPQQPLTLDHFVTGLLEDQQTMTAVDQFSQLHDSDETHLGEKYYRDLIPTGPPGEGEQYAFEVDLDVCSGCKACVAACHNLNGLEEGELWRDVGLLVGGATTLPIVQHVTTACHHCIEPACLEGCPVKAYEKDPLTGIVRHLDDQCIGCQYCMLKCPYDVPVYSKSKGIVRKCDMCHQRLSAGEAPACVQSCPNHAIRIRTVSHDDVREESEVHPFLPAAPAPRITLPTTIFKSERPLPRNTLPADYFSVQRSHGHMPLVVMLVLTQMSVGAFLIEYAMYSFFAVFHADIAAIVRPWHLGAALLLGMLGLTAAIFHLGRPLYAYRALLGLRTSWLSREILAFNLFAGAATVYVAVAYLDWLDWLERPIPEFVQSLLGGAAALSGLAAVMTSVMIYVDTKRPSWTIGKTTVKFMLTALVLGIPTTLLVSLATACFSDQLSIEAVMLDYGWTLCRLLVLVVAFKLTLELSFLVHLRDSQHTLRKRTALLLSGDLKKTTTRRFMFALVGGMALPLLLLNLSDIADDYTQQLLVVCTAMLMIACLLIGELHERYLFFAASVSAKMPGAPAT